MQKQLDAVSSLAEKYPQKFWAIFLGCMAKPASLADIAKRFGFSSKGLYQQALTQQMMDAGVLQSMPSPNSKTKLYYSRVDWLYPPNEWKRLNDLLNLPEIRKVFDMDNYMTATAQTLKDNAERMFYALVQIVQVCVFMPKHRISEQLVRSMLPLGISHIAFHAIVASLLDPSIITFNGLDKMGVPSGTEVIVSSKTAVSTLSLAQELAGEPPKSTPACANVRLTKNRPKTESEHKKKGK
jgi:hypothetical protein